MNQSDLQSSTSSKAVPRTAIWIDWLVEMRLHHWVKNTLVFLPLALTPELLSLQSLIQCVLGFLILSITCSGTYVLNDLLDCEADRQHPSKCRRPVASGRISRSSAQMGAAILGIIGLLSAIALNSSFAAYLAVYVFLSVSYSYYFKTLVLLDLVILATLFTLRMAMGVALIGGSFSAWLPVFVFLFFGGLSAAKRSAELVGQAQSGDHSYSRRGYRQGDLPLLIPLGISFSIGAVTVLAIFLSTVAVSEAIYRSPQRLWVAAVLLLAWTLRIWVNAVRGTLMDDPVLFALKDRFSLIVAVLMGLSILGAHLP